MLADDDDVKGTAPKKQDIIQEMAQKQQDDPKSYIENIFAGTVMGLTHPSCPPEEQMFQLFTQAPLSPAYNLPAMYDVQYPVDAETIVAAVKIMMGRHDCCRASYHMGSGTKALKRIHSNFPGDVHVLYKGDNQTSPLLDFMDNAKPFQLGVASTRFVIHAVHNDRRKSLSEKAPHVYMNLHHIVADGDGLGIAAQEFEAIISYLFRGFSPEALNERLPPITVQFHDYAYWLTSLENTGVLKDELAVWFNGITSSGPPEVLDVPTDLPRQRTFFPVGEGIRVGMDQELLAPILAAMPTTPYTVCFTFFTMAMARLTQANSFYVAIAYGTRPLPSLYPLIGSFLNMLPAQFQYYPMESFGTNLDRMSATQLMARKNSLAPFLSINNYVRSYNNPPFDPSRNPAYQSMLDMVPNGGEEAESGLNGVLDLFGFVEQPGGVIKFMTSNWNSSIVSRRTAQAFLNQVKALAIFSSKIASDGPADLASTTIPEMIGLPEMGVKAKGRASLGKFTLKVNAKDEDHPDAMDADCEVNLISGPEPADVPDEYDFFRRSKMFVAHSAIMPTVDVTHEYSPQYQNPPRLKPKKGQPVIAPTPQSTEVDASYKKKFSEPQLDWTEAPLETIEKPHQVHCSGEITFYDPKVGFGIVSVAEKGLDDLVFTKQSLPIKDRPSKKNPIDLTGTMCEFTCIRGAAETYAAGLNIKEQA